jgi:hypothetical protein
MILPGEGKSCHLQPADQASSFAEERLRAELAHRPRRDDVELAHRHLADRAGFVRRGQIATRRFNDPARHNAPAVKVVLTINLPHAKSLAWLRNRDGMTDGRLSTHC